MISTNGTKLQKNKIQKRKRKKKDKIQIVHNSPNQCFVTGEFTSTRFA